MRRPVLSLTISIALLMGLAAVRPEARSAALPRETWPAAPSLVVLTTLMNYAEGTIASGFRATAEQLTDRDLSELTQDLTRALRDLTDGAVDRFHSVVRERVAPGHVATMVRAGRIVVGRFKDLARLTTNLGYGGRRTHNGVINGGFILLDADADRKPEQRVFLRTHELGHALGFHHVESEPSVMNPTIKIGSTLDGLNREVR